MPLLPSQVYIKQDLPQGPSLRTGCLFNLWKQTAVSFIEQASLIRLPLPSQVYLEQGQPQGSAALSWPLSAASAPSAAAALTARQQQAAAALEPLSERWLDVAQLLSRKHDRIDPTHALSLLPDGVPLASVLPFLEGALRSGGEQRRNASVIKSLRRAENLQCREVAIRCRQRCGITIWPA